MTRKPKQLADPQVGTKPSKGQRAFAQFLLDRGIGMNDAAMVLGVSGPTVFAWAWGKKSPRPGKRDAIAAWTDGAIPAALWETEDEKRRREAMTGKRAA